VLGTRQASYCCLHLRASETLAHIKAGTAVSLSERTAPRFADERLRPTPPSTTTVSLCVRLSVTEEEGGVTQDYNRIVSCTDQPEKRYDSYRCRSRLQVLRLESERAQQANQTNKFRIFFGSPWPFSRSRSTYLTGARSDSGGTETSAAVPVLRPHRPHQQFQARPLAQKHHNEDFSRDHLTGPVRTSTRNLLDRQHCRARNSRAWDCRRRTGRMALERRRPECDVASKFRRMRGAVCYLKCVISCACAPASHLHVVCGIHVNKHTYTRRYLRPTSKSDW
jgi:hypothetical protein